LDRDDGRIPAMTCYRFWTSSESTIDIPVAPVAPRTRTFCFVVISAEVVIVDSLSFPWKLEVNLYISILDYVIRMSQTNLQIDLLINFVGNFYALGFSVSVVSIAIARWRKCR